MYWATVGVLVICTTIIQTLPNMGPFNVLVRNFEECKDVGTGEIGLAMKLKKFNRTTTVADINMTLKVPFDDDITSQISFAQLTNGGWKNNFYTIKIEKTCSASFAMVPKLMKEIFGALNMKGCPVQKGVYTARDFTPSPETDLMKVFFYNRYRGTCVYLRKGKKVGCLMLYVDFVPKRNY